MANQDDEKIIFEAFLKVCPDFATEKVADWRQPKDEKDFPDIICRSESDRCIGVELGEWLNENEIRSAKGQERIQESILLAIGDQGTNRTENIYAIWLLPKPRARIKESDKSRFRIELFQFISDVDRQWPSEKFWHGPQGYWARNDELSKYPVLQKYLNGIDFFPSDRYEGWPPYLRKVKRHWPEGQNWIIFPARGGAFSENTMLQPLYGLLSDKIGHYSDSGTGFDEVYLVIHYNSALIYNSPVETKHFKFEDAVDAAREFVGDDTGPFDNIYLFIAVDDGQVFKII